MHLLDVFRITDSYDTEGLHNIIVNVFEVVLEYSTALPPHALSQLEPNILLKVDALFHSEVGIPVVSKSITLIPSLEVSVNISFKSPRVHLSPVISFTDWLHSNRTVLYLLRADILSMVCVYKTLWSTFIVEVISRRSKTLLVRLRIVLTTMGPL